MTRHVAVPVCPDMDRNAAIEAEARLRSGTYDAAHIETILDWTTFMARRSLKLSCREAQGDYGYDEAFDPHHYKAFDLRCGGYSYSTSIILEQLGVKNFKKNISELTGTKSFHAFVVAHAAPQDQPEAAYLVDQTILQFFPHDDQRQAVIAEKPAYLREHLVRSFSQSDEAWAQGQQLVTRGWIRLDNDVIGHYVQPILQGIRTFTTSWVERLKMETTFSMQRNYVLNDMHRATPEKDKENAGFRWTPRRYYG